MVMKSDTQETMQTNLVQNRGPRKEHGNAIYKYFFSTLTAMKISGEMFVQCD